MPQASSNKTKQVVTSVKKQINWWIGFGITMPMTTLAFLFLLNLFGTDTIYSYALSFGGALFAMIGFIWWWWAIHAIAIFTDMMSRIGRNFEDLHKELSNLKKDFKKK